jgi:hypothetical protein
MTFAELDALFAAWRADIDSVPFAHGTALLAAAFAWADRQRYLAEVRQITDSANPAGA